MKGIAIPDDQEQRSRMIFDKLKEKHIPEDMYGQICHWLLEDSNRTEKEKCFFELFRDVFDYEKIPRKRAYKMYAEFIAALGTGEEEPFGLPLYRRTIFKVAAAAIPALVLLGSILASNRAEHCVNHYLSSSFVSSDRHVSVSDIPASQLSCGVRTKNKASLAPMPLRNPVRYDQQNPNNQDN